MEAPTPLKTPYNEYFIEKEIENKNEYIFNDYKYKLLVYLEDKYIIFNISKLDNISLYYYQKEYELKEIISLLNLNNYLYDNLGKIKELINEVYLNQKLSIYDMNNETNL